MVFIAAGVITCVDDANIVSSQGTVTYVPLEGGFFGVLGDDGHHWDPENLSAEFAVDSLRVAFQFVTTNHPTFHSWAPTIRVISMRKIGEPPAVNLEPFRALARNTSCADKKNRLFLIDGQLVFWDRESSCADAAYARTLYGRTTDRVICLDEDTVAGPRHGCSNSDRYGSMFEVIEQHLDAPDLGLGAGHTVKAIDF